MWSMIIKVKPRYGDRAFTHTGPRLWNLLPKSMKMLQIQNSFFQGAQDSLHCYHFYFCL